MNKLAKLLFLPCVILTTVTPTIYLTSCKSYPQYIKKFKVEVEKNNSGIEFICFYITYDCKISSITGCSSCLISGSKCLIKFSSLVNYSIFTNYRFERKFTIHAATADGGCYNSIIHGYVLFDGNSPYPTKIEDFTIKDVFQCQFIIIDN